MTQPLDTHTTTPRNAIVGIVGRTNSGKSTLVNQIIGEKVSIVSPTSQTTRNTVRGIHDEERGQLVLVDTPGLHKAHGNLGKLFNRMARHAAGGVDILAIVMDGSSPPQLEDDGWFRRILNSDQPCLILLNKHDRTSFDPTPFHDLWRSIQAENETQRPLDWFSLSAATGQGVPPIVDRLFELALPGERPYDRDTLSDYPRRLVIADIIREQYLRHLRDELPHELGIVIEDIVETPGAWEIQATIYVNRPSQKMIAIGPKGRLINRVKIDSEKEVSHQFDTDAIIAPWIKVEKNWMFNPWLLRQMGYTGSHQG